MLTEEIGGGVRVPVDCGVQRRLAVFINEVHLRTGVEQRRYRTRYSVGRGPAAREGGEVERPCSRPGGSPVVRVGAAIQQGFHGLGLGLPRRPVNRAEVVMRGIGIPPIVQEQLHALRVLVSPRGGYYGHVGWYGPVFQQQTTAHRIVVAGSSSQWRHGVAVCNIRVGPGLQEHLKRFVADAPGREADGTGPVGQPRVGPAWIAIEYPRQAFNVVHRGGGECVQLRAAPDQSPDDLPSRFQERRVRACTGGGGLEKCVPAVVPLRQQAGVALDELDDPVGEPHLDKAPRRNRRAVLFEQVVAVDAVMVGSGLERGDAVRSAHVCAGVQQQAHHVESALPAREGYRHAQVVVAVPAHVVDVGSSLHEHTGYFQHFRRGLAEESRGHQVQRRTRLGRYRVWIVPNRSSEGIALQHVVGVQQPGVDEGWLGIERTPDAIYIVVLDRYEEVDQVVNRVRSFGALPHARNKLRPATAAVLYGNDALGVVEGELRGEDISVG